MLKLFKKTGAKPIRGKVVKFAGPGQFVIDVGSEHGVKPGMAFEILDFAGEDVPDPETGENLGSVPVPLFRVRISRVGDRLSFAKARRVSSIGPFSRSLMPPSWVDKYEVVYSDPVAEGLTDRVSLGAPVIQVAPNR